MRPERTAAEQPAAPHAGPATMSTCGSPTSTVAVAPRRSSTSSPCTRPEGVKVVEPGAPAGSARRSTSAMARQGRLPATSR
jgi:hypothetical protein